MQYQRPLLKISKLRFVLRFSAPGGIILQEGENACRTNICLFGLADSLDQVKAFEQVFVKLMRRYFFYVLEHNFQVMKNFQVELSSFDLSSTDLRFIGLLQV